jgi:serine phosphatase RsbU (regulator of sigma subunit)
MKLPAWLQTFVMLGIRPQQSFVEQQRIRITNIVSLIAIGISPFYLFMAVVEQRMAATLTNIFTISLGCFCLWLQAKEKYVLSRWLLLLGNGTSFVLLTLFFGKYLSISYYLFALLALIPIILVTHRQIFWASISIITLTVINEYVRENFIPLFSVEFMKNVQYPNIVASALIMYFCLDLLKKEDEKYQQTIENQNKTLEFQKEEIEAQRDNLSDMNRAISQQAEEISAQRDDLERKNNLVEKKNKTITDSINYAKRIQLALLPSVEQIKHFLPESFIYYRPKDIVSGDFYWFEAVEVPHKKEPLLFLAVADCTGHGVPGAFMSMLGATFLSQIVTDTKIYEPSQILAELDARIRRQLRQDENDSDLRDGMDIGLCMIDREHRTVHFSAAQRPLIVVRHGEIIEIKGDKNPIGSGAYEEKSFTPHRVVLEPHDTVYMYSDGMTDQFNAANNKRYGSRQMKEFLVHLSENPVAYQYEKLSNNLKEWQGQTPQTDDMILIGWKL